MSRCIKCGDFIEFCYFEGKVRPFHLSGGCTGVLAEKSSSPKFGVSKVSDENRSFCRPTTCPRCPQEVFFIRYNGGAFWVDDLGWPWPKHLCFIESERVAERREFLSRYTKENNAIVALVVQVNTYPYAQNRPDLMIVKCADGSEHELQLGVLSEPQWWLDCLVVVNPDEKTVRGSKREVLKYKNLVDFEHKKIQQVEADRAENKCVDCLLCGIEVEETFLARHIENNHSWVLISNMARVQIIEEVCDDPIEDGWVLCFQKCIFHLEENETRAGFRFIWRRPNGTLQAARGQARIPDSETLERLLNKAKDAKWYG